MGRAYSRGRLHVDPFGLSRHPVNVHSRWLPRGATWGLFASCRDPLERGNGDDGHNGGDGGDVCQVILNRVEDICVCGREDGHMPDQKRIAVSEDTFRRVYRAKRYDETWDDTLRRLADQAEREKVEA